MESEFVKARHDFEFARQENITNALTMPIGVMTVVGGVLVAMARTFSYHNDILWRLMIRAADRNTGTNEKRSVEG